MEKKMLMIFTRNPDLGRVKTRLARTIGQEGALYVYQQLLMCTQSATKDVEADKYVFYDSYVPEFDSWDETYYKKSLQHGNDLGERMSNAFAEGFKQQYTSIVIVGSDCAGLSRDKINSAFEALEVNDFVIGPTKDGGYYLLGMKTFQPSLFYNKSWSTEQVFNDTLQEMKALNATVHILPTLADIDTEDDLVEMIQLKLL